MPTLNLTRLTGRNKFGIVRVFNQNGTLNRAFKINAQELDDVVHNRAGPPNVTLDEWKSGRTFVYGKDFDVGEVERLPDGSAIVKLAERTVGGDVLEAFCRIDASDLTGSDATITVQGADLGKIRVLTTRRGPILVNISSIANGVLTWQLA